MDETETFAVAGLAAPHGLAAAAGRDVLVEGGTVIEAAIAAAAVSAVVVPERNGIGGDALWLIREPGPRGRTRVLDGRGPVGAAARLSFYRERGLEAVPPHGTAAIAAVPGAAAAWSEAHALSAALGGRLPLARLLAPARAAARQGWDLGSAEAATLAAAAPLLAGMPGFAPAFLIDGTAPAAGTRVRQPALAATLDHLATAGLADLYRGDVAHELAADLAGLECPLGRDDLRAAEARWREPRGLDLGRHALTVPPTRAGLWAAAALGLFAGLGADGFEAEKRDGFARWHGLIESLRAGAATIDAAEAEGHDPAALVDAARLARASLGLDRTRAGRGIVPLAPPIDEAAVWIGAVDRDGAAVSLVQTLGGRFGAGIVSGRTGILLGNRAAALTIDPDLGPVLRPGRRVPLRALPALVTSPRAGRVVALGAEGEPAAALVVQVAGLLMRGAPLAEALEAPRFAFGAVPGDGDAAVLVEAERPPGPAAKLRSAGHVLVPADASLLRRLGAVLRDDTGRVAAGSDAGDVAGI